MNVIKKNPKLLWGLVETRTILPLCEGCIFDSDQVTNFPFESY
jgi:hypothetical protein